eukprot:CAMPEP_0194067168 /NCGR_PEP_ID=MMETSP0009_2-20130614/86415_1 /TAXON_ID=210454 /ORGANISM="Grammatophora oceanica, Strain CCMP 410" /LENGTH=86 /DNA_ID=CAMNT_0038720179 /DNA_START=2268 /DNA_END=2529 /DNA_ORIENTATION=+
MTNIQSRPFINIVTHNPYHPMSIQSSVLDRRSSTDVFRVSPKKGHHRAERISAENKLESRALALQLVPGNARSAPCCPFNLETDYR